jgi:hypothetical protein
MSGKKPIAMFGEVDGSVVGYMCLTDFEDELGGAQGGNTVFPSETDLRETRRCVAQCGIVKVQVIGLEIVQEPIYPDE